MVFWFVRFRGLAFPLFFEMERVKVYESREVNQGDGGVNENYVLNVGLI